jgi:hypothetical protein
MSDMGGDSAILAERQSSIPILNEGVITDKRVIGNAVIVRGSGSGSGSGLEKKNKIKNQTKIKEKNACSNYYVITPCRLSLFLRLGGLPK